MGIPLYKFVLLNGSIAKYSRIAIMLLTLSGFLGALANGAVAGPQACSRNPLAPAAADCVSYPAGSTSHCPPSCSVNAQTNCPSGSTQCVDQTVAVELPICSIYNTVHSIVFLLGLVLIILGGALYAGAHIMPGQTKGTVQGYGMGFILGGVIGVIIAILAPFIIGLISNQSGSTIASTCSTLTATS